MVVFERQPDSRWKPVTVYQATKTRLAGKTLPGDSNREGQVGRILSSAKPPNRDNYTNEAGNFEKDWIDWALDAFSNGYTDWTSEVVPENTVDQLFQREVLDVVGEQYVGRSEGEHSERTSDGPSSTEYRVEASERGDDLLRRYLPKERPAGFDSLPREDQAWRGRLFLMTWAFTGSAAFAWATASVTDPAEIAESKETVAGVPDARIEEELILSVDERDNVVFAYLGGVPQA